MAGKKKGRSRTQEQVALYAEIVRLMSTLNQRSAQAVTLAQQLAEAQARIPEILRHLSEQADRAGQGVERLGRGQKNSAAETKSFVQSLITLELSIRRIQGGFNGLKKTALFAEKTQKDVLQFSQLARSIDASASAMKALDQAGRKFGLGFGEVSNTIKSMKANLADLRWGGSGGGLGMLMRRWGGNFTGYETEKEMLLKLRRVFMRVAPRDRLLVARDAGVSEQMQDMLTSHKTEEEFLSFLNKEKIDNWEDAEKKAREGVTAQGEKANATENRERADMINLGSITNETNKLLTKILGFMEAHPWLTAAQMGLSAVGDVGNAAMGMLAIKNLLGGGIGRAAGAAGASGAATAAGSVASNVAAGAAGSAGLGVAGGLSAATLGWAALAVAAIGGIGYGLYKLDETLQDANRGKKEGETDEQANKREDKERQALIDKGATKTELDEYDKEKEENRQKRERNNALLEKQRAIADRYKKNEIISDADLFVLSQTTGVRDLDAEIDKLIPSRDVQTLRTQNAMNATLANQDGDFLAKQIAKYEKEKKVGALVEVFKDENRDKIDSKQWALFAEYLRTATSMGAVDKLKDFAADPTQGHTIPAIITEALDKAQGTAPTVTTRLGGYGAGGLTSEDDYTDVNKRKETAFRNIMDYGGLSKEEKQKVLDDEAAKEAQRREEAARKAWMKQLPRLQGLSYDSNNPYHGGDMKVEQSPSFIPNFDDFKLVMPDGTVSHEEGRQGFDAVKWYEDYKNLNWFAPFGDAMNGAFGKVGEVNFMADEAQTMGGVENAASVVHETKVENNTPIEVRTQVSVNQYIQNPEDAGDAATAIENAVNRDFEEGIMRFMEAQIGETYRSISGNETR